MTTSGTSLNSTDLPTDRNPSINGKPTQCCQNRVQSQSHFDTSAARSLPCFSRLRSRANFRTRSRRAFQYLKSWCTGEDSNLRSSKERQIYSLLPLTARPPVPKRPSDEDLSPEPRIHYLRRKGPKASHLPHPALSMPHFRASRPYRKTSGLSEHAPQWDHRGGQARRFKNPAPVLKLCCHFLARFLLLKWSWRRDLNPRPSDYKSDALPAELRQPDPP